MRFHAVMMFLCLLLAGQAHHLRSYGYAIAFAVMAATFGVLLAILAPRRPPRNVERHLEFLRMLGRC
jgi:hypothetical protein